MRLIADVHISPRTADFLNTLGHDVIASGSVMPADAPDGEIVEIAARQGRAVLTQDLGFSAIVASSGSAIPSLISLRLSQPLVDVVNQRLEQVLPTLEDEVAAGVIASVEDERVRIRLLPI